MPGDKLVTNFEEAIEVLGGTGATAERFGYAPSRVCQWRDRQGAIPAQLFLLARIELAKEGYRPTWEVFDFMREKHEPRPKNPAEEEEAQRAAVTAMATALRNQRAPLREHRDDCYDTSACAVHALLKVEQLPHRLWEPCCGTGNIVEVLRAAGHRVLATDLNDRGCPDSTACVDFLLPEWCADNCDAIVTNPPYALAEQFVATALERAPLVIMLLRLAFLESERRSPLLDGGQLARVHVFANRLPMMHRAGWTGPRASSGIAFAWFVWDRAHRGPATIDRIRWDA